MKRYKPKPPILGLDDTDVAHIEMRVSMTYRLGSQVSSILRKDDSLRQYIHASVKDIVLDRTQEKIASRPVKRWKFWQRLNLRGTVTK